MTDPVATVLFHYQMESLEDWKSVAKDIEGLKATGSIDIAVRIHISHMTFRESTGKKRDKKDNPATSPPCLAQFIIVEMFSFIQFIRMLLSTMNNVRLKDRPMHWNERGRIDQCKFFLKLISSKKQQSLTCLSLLIVYSSFVK